MVIDAEAFCEFCRKHTREVVGNRLTEERVDFVYHFVFPRVMATLLPVRESLKESNAYQEQMKGKHAARDTAGFESEDVNEEGNTLGRAHDRVRHSRFLVLPSCGRARAGSPDGQFSDRCIETQE